MEDTVFTFGYEGLTIDRFISRLRAASVCAVADVRAVPISRKKGFSKTALAQRLRSNGIEYQHFVELGCPKDVRDQYREDGSWALYEIGYLDHLRLQGPAIARLSHFVTTRATCLVCFEEDYTTCHRMYVARELSQTMRRVVHLTEGRAILDPVVRQAKAA